MSLQRSTTIAHISKFIVFSALLSGLFFGQRAHADTFSISATSHPFYISATSLLVRQGETVNYNHTAEQGGNLNGILNGVALDGTYCVNLTNPISVGSYNGTTVSYDGKTFGESIANAGAISWLMTNYAATATTVDQQNALQAAIWRTEYGSAFEVDGADNAKTGNSINMISFYKSYRTALGSNTASVDSVLWISPKLTSNNPSTHYQGLVGYKKSVAAVPEAGTVALIGLAMPILGAVVLRRKKA